MATKKATPAKKKSAPAAQKAKRAPKYVSFRLSKSDKPFISFELTVQTFYWAVIGLIVLALGVYVTVLQIRINALYDQVDTGDMRTQIYN